VNLPLGIRRRHSRLHDALCALDETQKLQAVEVPSDQKPRYYQKYAHTLAERWGFRVRTGLKVRGGNAILILQPKN